MNFTTYSADGIFADWEKNNSYCPSILKSRLPARPLRDEGAGATGAENARPRAFYWVPIPTAPRRVLLQQQVLPPREGDGRLRRQTRQGRRELSGGAEFTRSTNVTIEDATVVGISNPHIDVAGWRFDMPQVRAVNDLTPYGGPSMICDDLLQMPYPVQRGSMESKQYAIFRLPAAQRERLQGTDREPGPGGEQQDPAELDGQVLQSFQLQLQLRELGQEEQSARS